MLTNRWIQTAEPRTRTSSTRSKVRITASPNAVDNAYSVARFFQRTCASPTARDFTVTVELGAATLDDVMSAKALQRVLKSAVHRAALCRPTMDQSRTCDNATDEGRLRALLQ